MSPRRRSTPDGAVPRWRALEPSAKAGEALARRIEAEVVERGWPVGEILGTEPELLARYRVSRPVLREAVRLMEHHMVARMRRGSGGGLRVIEPDESAVTSAAALYLDYRGVRVRHLYAARTVLESRCVELAVQQLTEDGIARLRAVVKELKTDDPLLLVEMVHDVEGMIADLSGDPVLSLFVHVLLQLAHQHVMAPAERHPGRKRYLLAVRDHLVGVAEAVIAGDAPTARVRLCRYLELAESGARQHYLAAAGTHEGVVAAGL